jgi:hypothetical protein
LFHSNDAKIKKSNPSVTVKSALALFVARILADHTHDAFTADYLAIAANTLHRRQYFHFYNS